MIKPLLLLMLLTLSYLSNAQVRLETDLELENLYGSVRSVEISTFELVNAKEVLRKKTISSYNETGGQLKKVLIANDTSIMIHRCEYGSFQNKGNEWTYKDDGETILSEITRMYFGDSLLKMQITKEPNGNSIEEIRHYQDNILTQRTIAKSFNYEQASLDIENHENGLIVSKERISYYNGGQSELHSSYKYDEAILIGEDVMDKTQTLRIATTYSYHKNGEIETITVNGLAQGKLSKQYEHTFKYNKKDKLISEAMTTYSANPQSATTIENTFDKFGNTISTISYSESGRINEASYFEHKYDKKGNWIKKQTFKGEDKELVSKTVRVIEYF